MAMSNNDEMKAFFMKHLDEELTIREIVRNFRDPANVTSKMKTEMNRRISCAREALNNIPGYKFYSFRDPNNKNKNGSHILINEVLSAQAFDEDTQTFTIGNKIKDVWRSTKKRVVKQLVKANDVNEHLKTAPQIHGDQELTLIEKRDKG